MQGKKKERGNPVIHPSELCGPRTPPHPPTSSRDIPPDAAEPSSSSAHDVLSKVRADLNKCKRDFKALLRAERSTLRTFAHSQGVAVEDMPAYLTQGLAGVVQQATPQRGAGGARAGGRPAASTATTGKRTMQSAGGNRSGGIGGGSSAARRDERRCRSSEPLRRSRQSGGPSTVVGEAGAAGRIANGVVDGVDGVRGSMAANSRSWEYAALAKVRQGKSRRRDWVRGCVRV